MRYQIKKTRQTQRKQKGTLSTRSHSSIGKLRFLSGLFAKALNFFARKSYGIITKDFEAKVNGIKYWFWSKFVWLKTKDFEAKVYGIKYWFWSKFVWHYNEGFWGYFVLIKVWKKRGLINFCLDQSMPYPPIHETTSTRYRRDLATYRHSTTSN